MKRKISRETFPYCQSYNKRGTIFIYITDYIIESLFHHYEQTHLNVCQDRRADTELVSVLSNIEDIVQMSSVLIWIARLASVGIREWVSTSIVTKKHQ